MDQREHDPAMEMVREFHRIFGCVTEDSPTMHEAVRQRDEAVLYSSFLLMDNLAKLLKKAAADQGGSILLVRLQLIQEELAELAKAMVDGDAIAALDALADITYVTEGTYLSLGLADAKLPALREVHRSNLSKLGPDGRPILHASSRVMKGPDYKPPNLARVLEEVFP